MRLTDVQILCFMKADTRPVWPSHESNLCFSAGGEKMIKM